MKGEGVRIRATATGHFISGVMREFVPAISALYSYSKLELDGVVVILVSVPWKLWGRNREPSNEGAVKCLHGGVNVSFL